MGDRAVLESYAVRPASCDGSTCRPVALPLWQGRVLCRTQGSSVPEREPASEIRWRDPTTLPTMASEQTDRTRDFERFLTFIDAIVAIAITLLVLPLVGLSAQLGDGSVRALLEANATQILAFFLSFLVIANLWFDQHRALHTVIAHDPLVSPLIMTWTLTIVVLPFPTALVAQAGSQAATKVFYIGTIALSSALLAVLCWAIGRNRSIRDSDERPDPAPTIGALVCYAVALTTTLLIPRTSYYPLLLLFLARPGVRLWRNVTRRVRSTVPGKRPAPGDTR